MKRRGLIAAVLVAVAAPAMAQYSESYTFLKAVRERDGDKVAEITGNPSSTAINARESNTGDAALHMVVRGRDLKWVRFLLARGARPDIQNQDGDTPLMVAAGIGWVEAAEALLSVRANVNLPNNGGETPLIRAVQRRDVQMVRLLLSRGANPRHTDSVAGYSALDYARRDNRSAAILRMLEAPPVSTQTMGPTR
jgi:ankyrin repeat protein